MPKRVEPELVMGGSSVRASWTYAPIKYKRVSPGGTRTHRAYIDELDIHTDSYDGPPRIERIVIRVDPGEAIDQEMLDQVMPRVLASINESHAASHGVVPAGTPRSDLVAHMQAEPDPELTRQRIRKQQSRRDLNSAFIHEIAKRRNELIANGETVYDNLADEYGVSQKTVEKWIEIARHEYGLLEPTTRRGKGKRNAKR